MENNQIMLKKILMCAYIIIALIVINTVILICKGNITTGNNSSTSTEQSSEYDVSMMESVDLNTMLNDVFKRKDIQVVYMGRSTCSHCVSFLPTLQKAQNELNYTTVYLDIEKELPGPILQTNDEVIDAIKNIDKVNEEYKDKYQEFYNRFCCIDDGNAAKRVCEKVFGVE